MKRRKALVSLSILLLTMILLTPMITIADEIVFEWSQNPLTDEVASYILLEKLGTNTLYDPANPAMMFLANGDEAGVKQLGYYFPTHLVRGETYCYVLMAEDVYGNRSDYSDNEVCLVYDWENPIITVSVSAPRDFGIKSKSFGTD